MTLRGEIVDFVGLNLEQQPGERSGIGQIAVVQEKAGVAELRIGPDGIQPAAVEGARAPDDPMHLIALAE